MTGRGFIIKLIILILSIALFQIVTMEVLLIHIMRPSFGDIFVMLNKPGPVVATSLSTFIVMVYFYIRPLPLFLDAVSRGEDPDENEVMLIHRRGLNFPYFMAAFALLFYMPGAYIGTAMVGRELGWPGYMIFYGVVGGIISCLLATPMAIYAYHWLTEPVILLASEKAPGLAPSRSAGIRISVRTKLIICMLALAIAVAAYVAVVGYSQNMIILDNMEKVEASLPPSARAQLQERGVKLSEDFNQQSSLKKIYWSLLAVSSVLALVLALLAAHEITKPLKTLRDAAEGARQGSYGRPVRIISNDELSELGASFNRLMETITLHIGTSEAMLGTLRQGIMSMDETVGTVLSVSADQSSGATEQASAVEESSTISAQIVATAKNIAERAKAVVAEATRRLAQQSANASSDIRALMETIQKSTLQTIEVAEGGRQRVDAGGEAIRKVGEALARISSFAGSTTSAVSEITMSTGQQTTASEQLASSIMEVHNVAKRVEDGAKKIESVITQLQTFSEALRETVVKNDKT